ncbi:hypothetical protein FNF29_02775 [Cafeteria roenbergensis]|uniref:Uncharacterized protein n=1 Tax=Cafeteria roenbergensis TaxID=33653 RepID=A0A5A8DQH8_CAFRO|nr:hypothetical protein FNF29_02775 [Cafeteria roenbergensis]KAA0166887.1 hypothetical protein FNF31_01262 [Cafeteria roenbergensis]KAA0169445.1 hypothetical protein FNF28_02057 [Cafeteria roenbergensis]|eukprot:KAA0154155.1 hypothetical protein FNF29_02775 [Cafeteria roenbergensis]
MDSASAMALLVDFDGREVTAALCGRAAAAPESVVVVQSAVSDEMTKARGAAQAMRSLVGQRGWDMWSAGARSWQVHEGVGPAPATWGMPAGFESLKARRDGGLALGRLLRSGRQDPDDDPSRPGREANLLAMGTAAGKVQGGDTDTDDSDSDGDGDSEEGWWEPSGTLPVRETGRLLRADAAYPLCKALHHAAREAVQAAEQAADVASAKLPMSTFAVVAVPAWLSARADHRRIARAVSAGLRVGRGRVHIVPRSVAAAAAGMRADPCSGGAAAPSSAADAAGPAAVAPGDALSALLARPASLDRLSSRWAAMLGQGADKAVVAREREARANKPGPLSGQVLASAWPTVGVRLGLVSGLAAVVSSLACEAAVVSGGFVMPSAVSPEEDDASGDWGFAATSPADVGGGGHGSKASAGTGAGMGAGTGAAREEGQVKLIQMAEFGWRSVGGGTGVVGDERMELSLGEGAWEDQDGGGGGGGGKRGSEAKAAAMAAAAGGESQAESAAKLDAASGSAWLSRVEGGGSPAPIRGASAVVDPAGGLSFALARVIGRAALLNARVGMDAEGLTSDVGAAAAKRALTATLTALPSDGVGGAEGGGEALEVEELEDGEIEDHAADPTTAGRRGAAGKGSSDPALSGGAAAGGAVLGLPANFAEVLLGSWAVQEAGADPEQEGRNGAPSSGGSGGKGREDGPGAALAASVLGSEAEATRTALGTMLRWTNAATPASAGRVLPAMQRWWEGSVAPPPVAGDLLVSRCSVPGMRADVGVLLGAALLAVAGGRDLDAGRACAAILAGAPLQLAGEGEEDAVAQLRTASAAAVGTDFAVSLLAARWAGLALGPLDVVALSRGGAQSPQVLAPAAHAAVARAVVAAARRARPDDLAAALGGESRLSLSGAWLTEPACTLAVAAAVRSAPHCPKLVAAMPVVALGTAGAQTAIELKGQGAATTLALARPERPSPWARPGVMTGLAVLARCLAQPQDAQGAPKGVDEHAGAALTYAFDRLVRRSSAWR